MPICENGQCHLVILKSDESQYRVEALSLPEVQHACVTSSPIHHAVCVVAVAVAVVVAAVAVAVAVAVVVVVVVVVGVGCWLLVVGCWLLVVGCWLLVVG